MSQEPERRHRRRGLRWLSAAPVVLVLLGGAAYAVVQVSAPSSDAGKTAKPDSGASTTAIVSPPLAANGTGQATSDTTSTVTSAGTTSNANNGNSNGQANGKSLNASVKSVTSLFPGGTGMLTLQVDNPNSQDVILTGVTSSVTSVTTGNRVGIPRCDKSWFVIGGLSGSPRVGGRSSATITVPVSMVNTSNVNQDNCKGVTYQFSFTVNGRQA